MLQESKANELEYQRLSKDEMEQRGILGRLVGICADFISPTRNGRKYPEKLWENVFNDPIMKERIENGVCYGELGHPADREETDMEKIAVCMAEQPKKGKDGKLRAVFDILNTPNGRILKSLCDYGSTLGISSRGSGDLETDFDGNESVNPDTYNCEGFDVVLIPAVKEARLQYVNEALEKKRYNKTLRDKLQESISKETEEHQRVINESLSTLGMTLTEDFDSMIEDALDYYKENSFGYDSLLDYVNTDFGHYPQDKKEQIYQALKSKLLGESLNESQYEDFELQNTDSGTIVRTSTGEFVQEFPTEEEAQEWIDNQSLDESYYLEESKLTPEEKMDLWHNGQRRENIKACGDAKLYDYRRICKNKNYVREVTIIDGELQNRGLDVPEDSSNKTPKKVSTKPTCKMQNGELYILFDDAGVALLKKYVDIQDVVRELSGGREYFVINKTDSFANKLAKDLVKILNESYMTESLIEAFDLQDTNEEDIPLDIDVETEDVVADNDGTMLEELQQLLRTNKQLQEKITSLQEKLSVSYTKEMSLTEELNAERIKSVKLSKVVSEKFALNEQLASVKRSENTLNNKCTKLTESIERKNAKIQQLVEKLSNQEEQLKTLRKQVNEGTTALKEKEYSIEVITERYENLNKDYQQMKESYSKKVDKQNALVEKYRDVAVKSVNKYIDTQAVRLGITSAEIKNRLPESYSFSDIDRICEDLQEYKLNISNLPFSTGKKINENINVRVNNIDNRTLIPMEEELDDLTLRLAGL